jgi:hypothetical protein
LKRSRRSDAGHAGRSAGSPHRSARGPHRSRPLRIRRITHAFQVSPVSRRTMLFIAALASSLVLSTPTIVHESSSSRSPAPYELEAVVVDSQYDAAETDSEHRGVARARREGMIVISISRSRPRATAERVDGHNPVSFRGNSCHQGRRRVASVHLCRACQSDPLPIDVGENVSAVCSRFVMAQYPDCNIDS